MLFYALDSSQLILNLNSVKYFSVDGHICYYKDGECENITYTVTASLNNEKESIEMFVPENGDKESCIAFLKDLTEKINNSNSLLIISRDKPQKIT